MSQCHLLTLQDDYGPAPGRAPQGGWILGEPAPAVQENRSCPGKEPKAR